MLTTHDALAPNAVVMSIANPGLNLDGLMVDDLSLKRRAEAGRYKMLLFLDQSKRDSTVLDSVTEVLYLGKI